MDHIQPLVFVPGIMGSMSNEIVPGTGNWGFGPASIVYDKFIEKLENMGYKKDETLFICYYNWKQSCNSNAKRFLYKTIERAKKVSGAKKIDVVAHSLGGLVVRTYICSDFYGDDIDKLIMLSSPNTGATDAYYLWGEGKLPDRTGDDPNLLYMIVEGYLHILKRYYNIESTKELIHKEFKGVKELLPSKSFGSYLFYLDSQDIMRYISYDNLQYKNDFLDELNDNYKIYRKKGITIYLIAGAGKTTTKSIQIENASFDKKNNLVKGEEKSYKIRTYEGDGTVLVKSALEMVGIKYVVQSTHSDILIESEKIIRQILIRDYRRIQKQYLSQKDMISIVVCGSGRFKLKIDEKVYRVQQNIRMKDLYYHESGKIRWLFLEKEKNKNVAVYYDAYNNETIDVLINRNNEIKRERMMTHKLKQYQLIEA
ncbi:MAG: hypothetical protein MJA31_06220 [Clostridia bacterium]|nr:hypothetical protein [Clostridia bacterium]